MKCSYCSSNLDKNWEYCPGCGALLHVERDVFGDMFAKVFDEFKDMNSLFQKDIEAVDLSPWLRKPKGRGFSIKIVTGSGQKPRVEVQSFGDVDENQLKSRVYSQLGVRDFAPKEVAEPAKPKVFKSPPKTTEEPKTEIKRIGDKVIVEINLPGAKKEDIDVQELESSVEVKAVVGDKAYFKILTKPPQSSLIGKRFQGDLLSLDFA